MSVNPALSVVIPTRDRSAHVVEAVQSVLASGRDDVEVIVVDDGSVDDTADRLASIVDSRLIYRSVEAGGANRARNVGAGLSRAPLIAFLDSDDLFTAGRAGRLIAFFARHQEIDALVDGFIDQSPTRARQHRMPSVTPARGEIRRLLLAHQLPLTNSAITVRRHAWAAVCGHDEALLLHDDRDFLLRLAISHRLSFGQETDLIKRRGPGSISHAHDGYIAGLDALVARYPDYYQPDYADIFRYLIVRGILTALSRGQLRAVLREFRQLRSASSLPKDFVYSVSRYWAGRRQRHLALAAVEPIVSEPLLEPAE